MSIEGAMLGGYLLPENEFKILMKQLLSKNKQIIFNSLNVTLGYIQSNNIKQAYQEWDRFQTQILMNPSTQLLAILNFYNQDGVKQTWSLMDEANTITSGGLINVQKVASELRQGYSSEILATHLSNLFKTIDNEKLSNEELNYANQLKKAEIKNGLKSNKKMKKYDSTYDQIVYGSLTGIGKRGKVADAFLNHVGKTHFNEFSKFIKGKQIDLDHLKNTSVKQEENKSGKLNFLKLLLASLNNTTWYTGGDLIVVDSTGQVIANIQLKTSAGLGEAIGHISVEKLKSQIVQIYSLMNSDNEIIAENFYKMLKTSGVAEKIGDSAIQSAYQLAAKNLKIS